MMENRMTELEAQAMRRYCEEEKKLKDWAEKLDSAELTELAELYEKHYPQHVAREIIATIDKIKETKTKGGK